MQSKTARKCFFLRMLTQSGLPRLPLGHEKPHVPSNPWTGFRVETHNKLRPEFHVDLAVERVLVDGALELNHCKLASSLYCM